MTIAPPSPGLLGPRPASGRVWSRLALGAAVTVMLGCAAPTAPARPAPLAPIAPIAADPTMPTAEEPPPAAPATPPALVDAGNRVILVAIDGVRWQDIFLGVDPEIAKRVPMVEAEIRSAPQFLPVIYRRFFDEGAMLGAPGGGGEVWASGPNYISLPGYREMLSGDTGGCVTNDCGFIEQPTVADRVRETLAHRDEDVAVISSWERIERAAALHPERIVVSAGRHGGATRDKVRLDTETSRALDDGAISSPMPGEKDYRPDRFTATLALRYLERARPRFLFIGLGDTDEYAHARDYRSYLRALQDADRFLGTLFEKLAAMGEDGARTTVIVTADHGRNAAFDDHGGRWPESGRVFVLLGGKPVTARGKIDAGPGARLGTVAPTILSALGIPR